jgi:hypothetical protein
MTRRQRYVAADPDAAFLPNAMALVRAHLANTVNASARLVPNRPMCMGMRDGEMTPAEIWTIAESFVTRQTWSNKDEVLATLRAHLKVRVGTEMVTLERAQSILSESAANSFGGYAGGE